MRRFTNGKIVCIMEPVFQIKYRNVTDSNVITKYHCSLFSSVHFNLCLPTIPCQNSFCEKGLLMAKDVIVKNGFLNVTWRTFETVCIIKFYLCFPVELQSRNSILIISVMGQTCKIVTTFMSQHTCQRRWYLPVWRTVSGSKDGKRAQSADLLRTEKKHSSGFHLCTLHKV